MLTEHGCPIAQTTYYAALARARTPSARERRDEVLKVEIGRVYGENYRLYGARKVRLGSTARASRSLAVERLMSELGLLGARRGRRVRTTTADPLELDALEQAVWTRHQAGIVEFDGLIHHNDAGSQYTSIAFAERLAEACAAPSDTPTATLWPNR
ncbi:hypothetical protein GCM10023320_79830 [Pseudonocardia adelaidensis]|uniref:Helix-turn-helix protein n=1 Tax=Pseudonocardia adelaidensis TaxID=648754 RepID=A0ABP9P8Z4_9PSEU